MKRIACISGALLVILSITGCGMTGLTTKQNPNAPFGAVPQFTYEGINHELEALNKSIETLLEESPANPVDIWGWIAAAVGAAGAGGGVYVKRKLSQQDRKVEQVLRSTNTGTP